MSNSARSGCLVAGVGLLVVLMACPARADEACTVQRRRAVLRAGPGSYYASIAELAQGTRLQVLGELGGWYRVSVDTLTGYVSKKAAQEKAARQDDFAGMAGLRAEPEASQVVMSAGVKGFARKYSERFKGDPGFVDYCLAHRMDERLYEQFRAQTYEGFALDDVRRRVPLPASRGPGCFTFSEEGMGLGIASRIAGMGVYDNEPVQDYVNYVGNLVAEASDAYDVGFKFFVLDGPQISAYSCPGGIVFLGKGLLGMVRSEAELACVLGHEIVHVGRHHGMQEAEERKVEIIAKDALMELSEEDDPMAAVDRELDDLALSVFDRIFAGRLAEYEQESDSLGLLYAARAGYDPRAMSHLLTRAAMAQDSSGNEHYTKDQIAARQRQIAAFLKSRAWPEELLTNEARLRDHFATLR